MSPNPELIEALEEREGLLFLEPRSEFDECIVGLGQRFNDEFIVYDTSCCFGVLERQMADDEDPHAAAREYFSFNTIGAWVGEATPGFLVTDPGDI